MTDDPPTITDLIDQLEQLRSEHGDLPVVSTEEIWHVYPDPTVEVGVTYGKEVPDGNITAKRVEL